jgi:hypothetical protein
LIPWKLRDRLALAALGASPPSRSGGFLVASVVKYQFVALRVRTKSKFSVNDPEFEISGHVESVPLLVWPATSKYRDREPLAREQHQNELMVLF